MSERSFKAHEFGKRAGVTVRTLHYYDRLGLLKPSGRTPAGYRLYTEPDFARLEQIVALKFIGFSLRDIHKILKRIGEAPSLRPQSNARHYATEMLAALRLQRTVIEQKRRHLDRAVEAIRTAERALEPGAEGRKPQKPDWDIFRKIIEVIQMQNNKQEWMMKYYNDAAKAKIAERQKEWNPALQEQVSKQWMELIGDVKAALAEDPAGEKGQALAARWMKLVEGFTGGDPNVLNGLRKLYADKANWPAEAKQHMMQFQIAGDVRAFIDKAIEERKRRAQS
jgi:MerR family transcriptional regulator, thiopeptide resistance regulator